jgi:large subunit ribosomal protein L4
MAKLNVIDLTGASVGDIDVADDVFAAEVKEHLLWEVVRAQRAAKRRGTANAKTRAEVRATKAKVYRQKGTGHARHGSRRSNIFRGGGVVHGPRPRSYDLHVNKQVMAGALRSVLSLRAQAGDLLVIRAFEGEQVKTKQLAQALIQVTKMDRPKALLVDDQENRWLRLSSRNLPNANFMADGGVNVYDVLRHPKLLISETSLRKLETRLRLSKKAAARKAAKAEAARADAIAEGGAA